MSEITFFSVSNLSLGKISLQEVEKLVGVKGELNLDGVVFTLPNPEQIISLFQRNQSFTSLSLMLQKLKDFSELNLDKDFLTKLFESAENKQLKFKLEIEGVKGNENRIDLGKKIYQPLIEQFKEKANLELSIDFKNPDLVFQIYYAGKEETGKDYLFGLRLNKENFDSRSYRVFAHQASFKGDLAYRYLQEFEVNKEDDVLLAFVRDGTLAIETAIFQNGLKVRKIQTEDFITKISYLNNLVKNVKEESNSEIKKVSAFDEKLGNIRSAKNNSKIAKVLDYINFVICSVDDLDLKFQGQEFDKIIVHLTHKDENKLNEVYYQASQVLKKGGRMLFITRPGFELIISDKYEKVFEKEIPRGGSSYQLVCLEKK